MRATRIIALAVAVLVVASACSTATSTTTTTSAPAAVTPTTVPLDIVPNDYAGFLRQTPACGATTPQPAVDMKFNEPGDAEVAGAVVVTLETSCGPIEITLDPSVAPETVNSFVFLLEQGYFTGTASHRIIPGFMMQAGDPTATGLGGPGYTVPDELPAPGNVYERGVVAMANAGPNTAGSQFFIMFGTADWLPPQYTIFGSITSGFETLDAIEQIPLGQGAGGDPTPSTPLESLFIESVTVTR